jgi:hypothetical protein
MLKSKLKDVLSNTIKSKLKSKFNKNSPQEIKEKLESYLPKSYTLLKELYHLKIKENKSPNLNLAKKLKKYILSKIPADNKNDSIEDYPLLNPNNNLNNEVSFDINNNQILINDVVYQIIPLKSNDNKLTINAVADNAVTDNAVTDNAVADNSVTDNAVTDNAVTDNAVTDNAVADNAVADNINTITEESLKTFINNIVAPEQVISVVRLGFEIKTIYDIIVDSSDLISNEKQNDSNLDNKINEILELCLIIIDTCQIAVDSEEEDNIELIDNIARLIDDLNNEITCLIKYIQNNINLQDNISLNDFLKIIINLSYNLSNIIKNF